MTTALELDRCPECREPVMVRFTDGQRRVLLDPERELVGLYSIDEHGRAVRRRLVTMAHEAAGEDHGGGFNSHVCASYVDKRYVI